MVAEKQLDEFISRIQKAAGDNLRTVILYGSAAAGDFNPEFSNLNLLCILRDIDFGHLSAIASVVEWWHRDKHPAPLVMTRDELERSVDVFPIELLDMQQHHRVLFGENLVTGLQIPMRLHRAQVEYELREKLILLRQRLMLAAGKERELWELLLRSLPAFATLIRHALIALGDVAPRTKREAVSAIATRIPFDPTPLLQLLDIREHKVDRRTLAVNDVFARYLAAVQQVTAAVDTMLETSGQV